MPQILFSHLMRKLNPRVLHYAFYSRNFVTLALSNFEMLGAFVLFYCLLYSFLWAFKMSNITTLRCLIRLNITSGLKMFFQWHGRLFPRHKHQVMCLYVLACSIYHRGQWGASYPILKHLQFILNF